MTIDFISGLEALRRKMNANTPHACAKLETTKLFVPTVDAIKMENSPRHPGTSEIITPTGELVGISSDNNNTLHLFADKLER